MGEDPSARVRFDLRFANPILAIAFLRHFLTVDHDGRAGARTRRACNEVR